MIMLRRLILAVLGVSVAALSAMAAPAGAAFQLHALLGTFGPAPAASFVDVEGIAVDSSTGDVYVYDAGGAAGAGSVSKFTAGGEPLAFSPTVKVIEGVGHLTSGENELAIDASAGPGKGDIYVANGIHVGIYGPDGKPIEAGGHPVELNGEGTPWGEPCGVATDPEGRVYVGLFPETVNRYVPQPGPDPVTNASYTSSLFNVNQVCNIATDGESGVYVDSFESGAISLYEIAQFNTENVAAVGTPIAAGVNGARTLAGYAQGAKHQLYVDEQGNLAEYETQSVPSLVGRFGESENGGLSGSYGVAVNTSAGAGASGDIYASSGTGKIDIFAPTRPAAPAIEGESTSNVASTSATLEASINPSAADTTYQFQYGTQAGSYTTTVPIPAADIGAGVHTVEVNVPLLGLAPATTYHYRVLASNFIEGKTETSRGPDQTFHTSQQGMFSLPDGRAWEMVSPLQKGGGNIQGLAGISEGGVAEASADGSSVTYLSLASFDHSHGAPVGSQYLSHRQSTEWSVENLAAPLESESYNLADRGTPYRAFSEDLALSVMQTGKEPLNTPPAPGLPPPGPNALYIRDNATALFQQLGEPLFFQAATPDLRHVIVEDSVEDKGVPFEWGPSGLQPVAILPGGEPAADGRLGSGFDESHTISADGSRVFWSTEPAEPRALYMREGGSTIEIDTSHGPDPSGGGFFQTASEDGSRVFFTDESRLTSDSTARGGTPDLYEYDLPEARLSDLSAGREGPERSGVLGVLGASADGTNVYFVSDGVLAPGASLGDCDNTGHDHVCNLYLRHGGATTFIAQLLEKDEATSFTEGAAHDWATPVFLRTSRVAPNGSVVFMSQARLTSYDNRDIKTGLPDEEVYLYDPASPGGVSCVSCNPSGARPVGPSLIPAADSFEVHDAAYDSRVLSEQGPPTGKRVFFDSRDALSAQDSNGKQDVYEWEENGVGSCPARPAEPSTRGCTYLISSGTSSEDSSFLDASAEGNDVFFITSQKLAAGDTDQLGDLYDARVGGGFPAAPHTACTGTGCQGVPAAPPIFATPATATFEGIGNFPSPAAPVPAGKPRPLTRAQKLSKALRACRRKHGRRRASCERQARKRFGVAIRKHGVPKRKR